MQKEVIVEKNQGHMFWIEVHIGHLLHNINILQKHLGPTINMLPVVKADAYGHGAVAISKELQKNSSVIGLAVSSVAEGIELRCSGINIPIFILEYISPGQEESIVDCDLVPLLTNLSMAEKLGLLGKEKQKKVQVQVRVAVEAGNIGVSIDELPNLLLQIKGMEWLELKGFFTHLYAAYSKNDVMVAKQLSVFKKAVKMANDYNITFPLTHAASSPAILKYPDSYFNTVRPGTIMYGLPSFEDQEDTGLRPVMQLKSKITNIITLPAGGVIAGYVKQPYCSSTMRLATVPLGYRDAPFLLNMQGGEVLVKGERTKIVGSPFMTHLLVDVTRICEANLGDEVVFFGEQVEDTIKAEDIANKAGIGATHCESICFLSSRIPRSFIL
ncbi:alanine racemase [Natranaerofaba carboxydovora]|uniref:alanine racemase n=1 Tax=Natranaerofaba carboxydovora TaxID=2742683 RepID=UPI001F132B04|nr:alanine racemase [Natranaerofaba carboxydovora]UMZ72805.1 Alanine racemase 1 [Natranaerofaba carboxydovora]